jgi:hypothetical protein
MPDVIALIEHDHREVERMFAQFEMTGSYDVALQICDELTAHSEAEEAVVYPVLKRLDSELEQHAEEEHAEAKLLISKIEEMDEDSPQLVDTVLKLKESIQHHVAEEESKALPKMRAEASDQLDALGRRFDDTKQSMTTGASSTTADMASADGSTENLIDLTKEELYSMAKEQNIPGRSNMTKRELAETLQRRG